VHEVGEYEGRVFLAMELIEGQTLAKRIAQGPIPPKQVIALGIEIADALNRAHEAGIVHRDLKPGNIMLDRDDQVKLLDFGLAKRVDSAAEDADTVSVLTQADHILGTPGYMAPEQAVGKQVDGRSDLFSLGAIFYEMLTGRKAFGGCTAADRLVAAAKEQPPPLEPPDDETPAELTSLIYECLNKDPVERPASAAAVATTLEGIGAQWGSTQRTGKMLSDSIAASHVTKRRRRGWTLLVLAGAALVLGVAFTVWRQSVNGPPVASTSVPKAANLLAPDDAIVACPVFEVKGSKGSSGRLGAAAATNACAAMAVWWAMALERTRAPARLLGLPKLATDDFPPAPYLASDIRKRTGAAAARYSAILDGTLTVYDKDFGLQLSLTTPSGRSVASTQVRSFAIQVAAYEAVAKLLEQAGVKPKPVDEERRSISVCRDGRDFLRAKIADEKIELGRELPRQCEALASISAPWAASRAGLCGHSERDANGLPRWPINLRSEIDKLPPLGRWYWSVALNQRRTPQWAREQLAELKRRRSTVRRASTKAAFSTHEAVLSLIVADPVGARTAHDRALELVPQSCGARSLFSLVADASAAEPLARAASAWCPHDANIWWIRGQIAKRREPIVDFQRMAFLLSARHPDKATGYAQTLLRVGHREQVRSLASQYLDATTEPQRLAGEFIQGLYEYSRGRLAAALRRFRTNLLARRPQSQTFITYFSMLGALLNIEFLLEQRKVTDAVLEHLILGDSPPAYEHFIPISVAIAATYASPTIGRRTLERLRQLTKDGKVVSYHGSYQAFLKGSERFLAGDNAGAVAAWRPLLDQRIGLRPEAFDRVGESVIASNLDRFTIEWSGEVVTKADVREAQRANKRGDYKEAKRLAQRAIDAWETADTRVPAVAEMRILLAHIPSDNQSGASK